MTRRSERPPLILFFTNEAQYVMDEFGTRAQANKLKKVRKKVRKNLRLLRDVRPG